MADIGQLKKSPADYIDTSKIAEALNVNMEGVPGATDISKIKERVTTPQAATTELGSLAEQEQRLRKVIGGLESGRETALKIGEAGVAEYAADRATQIKQGQEQIKLENPLPKFIPTQENVQSLSTLFSLLGVVAIGGGSKNKLSAMGALNSMTGMLKGWREGRADLWKQEQIKFEKDMAQVKANLDSAAREADLALKMLPYDVRKAEAMMQELVAKTGSQILTQKANLQGVQEAAKYVKELQSGFKEAFEQNLKTKNLELREAQLKQTKELANKREAATERRHREDMAQRKELAQIKASQPKGQASAANTRYAFNMAESFGQTAQDLVNITNAPKGTVMGNFAELAGKSGDSLKQGLSAAFGRKVTDQDSRMFAQLVAGLDQNMARTLGGGYANSGAKHAIEAYKQQIPREGDSPAVSALFLARFKQELGIFADVFSAHPGANEQMAGKVNKYVDAINKAIPFTVNDVLNATRGSRQTINQQFENLATPQGSVNLPVDTGQAPAVGKTVLRQGKVTSGPNAGKTKVEYSDGTSEYK